MGYRFELQGPVSMRTGLILILLLRLVVLQYMYVCGRIWKDEQNFPCPSLTLFFPQLIRPIYQLDDYNYDAFCVTCVTFYLM